MTERFEEIEVKRISVVDEVGTLRLTISGKERRPDVVIDGKVLRSRKGESAPGINFFNDEGDECGGISWEGGKTDGGHEASMGLMFDQYKQDQIVVLQNLEMNDERFTALQFLDRPEVSMATMMDDYKKVNEMPEGDEKKSRLAELRERYPPPVQRVQLGRSAEAASVFILHDSKGRPRIMAQVNPNDEPRLQFLDEEGDVVLQLPPNPQGGSDGKVR